MNSPIHHDEAVGAVVAGACTPIVLPAITILPWIGSSTAGGCPSKMPLLSALDRSGTPLMNQSRKFDSSRLSKSKPQRLIKPPP